eukprot:TRINITY_DN14384_c3_g1_i1.p1 TRINITY_DN14384_c3_g1~~TRINITY_DN14384_c3_g1_i1.p1  ORF type:complete len:920 (-),score=200.21 TRINITY_DN14384_c3_g1_i1:74-2833(-)
MDKAPPDAASAQAATAASATATAVAAAAAAVLANREDVSSEIYLGVVKSYNDRRGFGFVACTETAAKFGRDVYMPKAEATLAAAEYEGLEIDVEAAAAAAAAAASAEKAAAAALAAAAAQKATSAGVDAASGDKEKAEKPPPAPRLAEEDLVCFCVRLSIEGFPQAARVKKLHKYTGTVVKPPGTGQLPSDEGKAEPGVIDCAELLEARGYRTVTVHHGSCGQVRLAAGDEVTFCVPQEGDLKEPDGTDCAANGPQAKMVCLLQTKRQSGSVLGCFALDLPRTGLPEGSPARPNLTLDCHAFGDKLVLAGLPADLWEAELLRFFSKQGATGVIVAHAKSRSFASVSFPSSTEVSRFLSRTAHAFADEKETRIARLLPLNMEDTARLPALPAPTLTVGEEPASLLVVWSPLVLAVGYSVELRPAGVDGPWATVEAGSSRLGTAGSTSGARFNSDCSSCRVTGLSAGVAYEARVSYFTDCGTRSEASEASDWCITQSVPGQPVAPPVVPPRTDIPTAVPPRPVGGAGTIMAGSPEDFTQAYMATAAPPGADGTTAGLLPGAGWFQTAPTLGQAPTALPPMAPPAYPCGADPAAFTPGALPAYAPSPGWRSMTGMVVPPPARPALRPADEHGFAVSVQWPAVAQASAYVVELREAGSAAFERFVRSAPEAKLGTLVELRVGGLRPGPPPGRVYVAQVRTVAVDGSESAPSQPGWSPPLPSQPPTTTSPGVTPTGPGLSSSTAPSATILSADSAPFTPSAATVATVAAAAAAAASQAAGASQAAAVASSAAPMATVPPQQPVVGGMSNGAAWAPPPWLGQQHLNAGCMAQPLGNFCAGGQAVATGQGGLGNGQIATAEAMAAPPASAPGAVDAAEKVMAWGVHSGPPPPPVAPPPPVQAAGALRIGEQPPPEITGHEECLILD